MRIENLLSCTGCHACLSVCPKSAITMNENSEGFLYPQINSNKCIKCCLCERACPALNPIKKKNEGTKAYAAINKKEVIRLDSSSGGIFTAIAEKIIEENGVVFGAKFTSDFSVVHGWTDTIKGLADFRGSKYLQSVIGNSYKECNAFLESGRKVLFSGTPCQVQGLKKYLQKEYENLLTVDFICHGVPSPLLWKKYADYQAEKFRAKREGIVKTAFRRKDDGWKLYSLSFTFSNDSEYRATLNKDPYMQIFLKDIALRESCYDCKCRGIARPSDITLADFWGVQNVLPAMDDDKGTSFVIAHSEKGSDLIDSTKNTCTFKEIKVEDGIKYNAASIESPKRPKQRLCFYVDLGKLPFDKIVKKYAGAPLYLHSYRCIRRGMVKILKCIVGKNGVERIKKAMGKTK